MYNSYNATLKTPYLLINDHEIDYEHDIQGKSNNKRLGKKWLKEICDILSELSARFQLEN